MHTTAPEPRSPDGLTLLTDLLGPWRTFARAQGLPRPKDSGTQQVPTGLLAALVAPVFTARWMGTQDPSMLVPQPPALTLQEVGVGKLDPAVPLTVDVAQVGTQAWTVQCTQDGRNVGTVRFSWTS